jgi:sporulation protein YlmC with PRC-barrel domain
MFLSELLGATVETESGELLGQLLDLRLDEQKNTITGLVVDDRAFVTRLVRGRDDSGRRLPVSALPWESVMRLEPGRPVVVGTDSSPGKKGKRSR